MKLNPKITLINTNIQSYTKTSGREHERAHQVSK